MKNPFLQYSLYPYLYMLLFLYATSDISYICLTSDAVADQQRANEHHQKWEWNTTCKFLCPQRHNFTIRLFR